MTLIGGNATQKELTLFIERIESLNNEIADRQGDRRDVFAEAKSQGFDVRTMREVIKTRKLEPHVRQERKALLDTYLAAFGIDD